MLAPAPSRMSAAVAAQVAVAIPALNEEQSIAEVIRGKEPSRIPFHGTAKISRSVNLENARRQGVTIPAEWVKTADMVVPSSQPTH